MKKYFIAKWIVITIGVMMHPFTFKGFGQSATNSTYFPKVSDSLITNIFITDSSTITDFTVINSANTAPGSPTTGATYLVGNSPSGTFSGHAKQIATWNGSAWTYITATQGNYLYNTTTALTYQFRSGNWVQITGIPALNNGNSISSGLTIGTNNLKSLNFETNNIKRGRIDSSGNWHINAILDDTIGVKILALKGDKVVKVNNEFGSTGGGSGSQTFQQTLDEGANLNKDNAIISRHSFFIANDSAGGAIALTPNYVGSNLVDTTDEDATSYGSGVVISDKLAGSFSTYEEGLSQSGIFVEKDRVSLASFKNGTGSITLEINPTSARLDGLPTFNNPVKLLARKLDNDLCYLDVDSAFNKVFPKGANYISGNYEIQPSDEGKLLFGLSDDSIIITMPSGVIFNGFQRIGILIINKGRFQTDQLTPNVFPLTQKKSGHDIGENGAEIIECLTIADDGSGNSMLVPTNTVIKNDNGQFKTWRKYQDDRINSFKIYSAILDQSGTSAPVATVLENTLNGIPTFTRMGVGSYFIELTGEFTADKTIVLIGQGATGSLSSTIINTIDDAPNIIYLNTYDDLGNLSDDKMYHTSIEIKVYK